MYPSPSLIERDDGITVTEIPDGAPVPGAPGLFGSVLESYRLQGYEAGYARAARELPAAVASEIVEFLRAHPETSAEARRTLLQFESLLLSRSHAPASPYVEGGLGI